MNFYFAMALWPKKVFQYAVIKQITFMTEELQFYVQDRD
jgi:hypothetical protein